MSCTKNKKRYKKIEIKNKLILIGFDTMSTAKFWKMDDFKKIERIVQKGKVIKNKWDIKNKKWFVKIRYNVIDQKF